MEASRQWGPAATKAQEDVVNILVVAMWVLFAIYWAVSVYLYVTAPGQQVLVLMVTAVIIAVVHGSIRYGVKGMLFFFLITEVVGYFFENLSISTGFPFGWYYYTNKFQLPEIGRVPLDVGTLYFAQGYNAWVIANILWDKADARFGQKYFVVAVPVTAAFVMCLWDVCLDIGTSTIDKNWIWVEGGGFFGVPLSNYKGWYAVVFCFLQGFAIYLSKQDAGVYGEQPPAVHTPYWLLPVAMYLSAGLGYIIVYHTAAPGEVTDNVGHIWRKEDIRETQAIVSLYTMVFISILAILRQCAPAPAPGFGFAGLQTQQ